MFHQTLKTNIIVLFLLLVGVVSTSLLISQYYFNRTLAASATEKTFELISNNISQSLYKNHEKMQDILNANKHNLNFYKTIEYENNEKAFHDLTQMMKMNKGLYAMFFTHKDGSFYEVINMNASKLIYDLYKAPKETRWLTVTNINNVARYGFYDKNQKLLSKVKEVKKYNSLTRPWYTQAIASKTAIRTAPYLFVNLKTSGVTSALELDNKGTVFGIDYTLDRLNSILALQKFEENSEIFVFNQHGSKFASSDIAQKITQEKSKTLEAKSAIEFTEQEQKYLDKQVPIIFSNEDDWAPFDFKAAAKPMGYSIDLIKLLAEKSSLKVEFVNGFIWSKIMQMFVSKDIDVVHSLYKTPDREKQGAFSKPIYSFKNYFITTKYNSISSIKDLEFKKELPKYKSNRI
ncbi:transporter substrate-binding domain-containing protein [Sulfurimonas sp.]|uniref:transporter substrate-binding domain-containing protein n=1 Tax=Sulfurimonas sp. TaxID=2022749 RepID=UPI003454D41A